jgi:hypothetical protein
MEHVKKIQLIKHLVTLTQLQFKVAKITQEKIISFKNVILGWGWLQCFKKQNPNLSLQIAQGLKTKHVKGFCLTNI